MTGTHPLLRVFGRIGALSCSESLKYGEHLLFRHDLYDHPALRLPSGVTNLNESHNALVVHNQLANYALFTPPDLQVGYVLRYGDTVVHLIDELPAALACRSFHNEPPRIRQLRVTI